jgi:hypothetical protein
VSVFGWRLLRNRPHAQTTPPTAQPTAGQGATEPQSSIVQVPSATSAASGSPNHLGPFMIAGQSYTVALETKKVRPGSANDQGDTVVAMEIRDASGAVQYRRTFPYVEGTADYFESWSVSALPLTGTNGTGLLISYDNYSEPSAPEEEPTGWFQIFGEMNGKLAPYGAPFQIQGGLLDQYSDGHVYKAARPFGGQSDEVGFKVWTGHCRIIYPVRVDWGRGKLSPAQNCETVSGELSAGCQYKILPEDKLYNDEITFVRLWPSPSEKTGQPIKTVVKKESKVELLTALVSTQWIDSSAANTSENTKGPLSDAGAIGLADDADLWLKVRVDGKEGWIHSQEDFQALGLPEDE